MIMWLFSHRRSLLCPFMSDKHPKAKGNYIKFSLFYNSTWKTKYFWQRVSRFSLLSSSSLKLHIFIKIDRMSQNCCFHTNLRKKSFPWVKIYIQTTSYNHDPSYNLNTNWSSLIQLSVNLGSPGYDELMIK